MAKATKTPVEKKDSKAKTALSNKSIDVKTSSTKTASASKASAKAKSEKVLESKPQTSKKKAESTPSATKSSAAKNSTKTTAKSSAAAKPQADKKATATSVKSTKKTIITAEPVVVQPPKTIVEISLAPEKKTSAKKKTETPAPVPVPEPETETHTIEIHLTAKVAPKKPAAREYDNEPMKDARLPGTVRYSDEDLEEFRQHIESIRAEKVDEFRIARSRLEEISNQEMADENNSYAVHMAEQCTEAQEKEKIYAQAQRQNDYIRKLDEALERIRNKTYGICRMCNCLIAKERLLAVPITTLSASYKIHGRCPVDGIDRITAPAALK